MLASYIARLNVKIELKVYGSLCIYDLFRNFIRLELNVIDAICF